MKRSMIAPLTISAAAAISLAAAGPALAGPPAPAPLKCMASMSNSHPAVNTTTDVVVRTVRSGEVFTVADSTTGPRVHYEKAGSKLGKAVIPYEVRGADLGYEIGVKVTVVQGHQANSCWTSFKPKP
jgi:hypothetical protein